MTFSTIFALAEESETEELYFTDEFENVDFNVGRTVTADYIEQITALQLTLEETVGAVPMGGTNVNVASLLAADDSRAAGDDRKKPTINDGYYTINGNKDIVILGNQKQQLYKYATYEWNTAASFTLLTSLTLVI